MTSVLAEAALAISRSAELSIVVKATVIVLLGLSTARLAPRARASTRHLILSLTCAGLLALPLVPAVAPDLSFQVPVSSVAESFQQPIETPQPSAPTSSRAGAAARSAAEASRSSSSSIPLAALIRVVWSCGAVLLLASLGSAVWRLGRMRRRGLPWPALGALVGRLAADAGIRRPVEVLLHEDVVAPVTCGFVRPAILLPPDAPGWSEANLRRALVHELEHVRRGDWAVYLIARATCAIYWFHPLAWVTLRQLSLEAERACDDVVVLRAGRADYAEQLVELARRLARAQEQPTLAMANRSDLSTRVSAILDATQQRGRTGIVPATLTCAAAIALVSAVAPLRAVAVPPDGGATEARQEAPGPGAALPAPFAPTLDQALFEAADEGALDDISALIAAGANVNAGLLGDGSPLIAAARSGHLDSVRLLLDHGADSNLIVDGDGSPLIMAAREGHVEIVELLLSRSARIDQVAPDDENALIQASAEGHLPVVSLLIERGADVNRRVWAERGHAGPDRPRGEWRTPMSMARRGRHDAVVAYLVSAGARE